MIRVEQFSKSYGAQCLFDNLSFSIAPGEKIGLVGRNGYGKTTLFLMLLGKIEPDSGNVSFPRNYRIGFLNQQIQFTQDTVLKEGCLGFCKEEQSSVWKVEKILAGLGFSQDDMYRHPQTFSEGYQIRLNLAKVLLSEPDLMLLDEPNNYLDIVAIRWLTNFLKNWKKELLLITHDRMFMDTITTHTMIIHRQKMRKVKGGTEKIYQQIALEEEVYEKARVNEEKRKKHLEIFISRFRAKARLAGMVQSRVKMLQKQEQKRALSKVENLEFSFHYTNFPSTQMLIAHNLKFSYSGQEPWLIQKLSFNIGKNERICVIGKNGKGKSTLLRIVAGELVLADGTIKKHPLLKTAFFGQTALSQLNEQKTVYEEIMSADADCLPQQARSICGAMMFSGDLALKPVGVLSGGEKSRLLLGKLLVTPCNLLLLDEPTNHLDLESCESLLEAIEEFPGSVVMVTHNELYLHRLATRLIVFDRGKVMLFEGTYQEFLDNVGWESENEKGESSTRVGKSEIYTKKIMKKKKAELLQEKSRILKPLELKLKKQEAEISSMEQELHLCTEKLIQTSAIGNGAVIAELSKQSHHLRSEIEKCYNKLENVLKQYEAKMCEYKEKMAVFEQI